MFVESYVGLRDLFETRADELTEYVKMGIELGRNTTGAEYKKGLEQLVAIRLQMQ